MSDPTTALQRARAALGIHRPDLAEQHYREWLATRPDDGEALGFVGTRLLRRGELRSALDVLQRALSSNPDDAIVNESLGIALVRSGDPERGAVQLQRALQLDAGLHRARLMLGKALTALGRHEQAAIEYHRAVTTAQKQGIWTSEETTPGPLRAEVVEAVRITRQRQRDLVSAGLEPVRARHGSAALQRIETCIASYLGERSDTPTHAQQRPKTLYFPGLPAQPFIPPAELPWIDALRTRTSAIRDEALALRASPTRTFESFLTFTSADQVDRHLRSSSDQPPTWDAFFFYRHGRRYDRNHADCPVTSATLERSPLARVRDHSPEICFSVLTPGTHILPHHGDTNTRVVVHLPLVVPPGCALNVGGERHEWREGEPVVFDDTFEHEAWNRGPGDRIVLILDAWNPYLTEAEREALAAMVPVLGDFNRACQIPSSGRRVIRS